MSERPSPQVTAGTSRGWRIPGKHDLAVEGRNIGRVVVSTFTDNLPYDWVCVTVCDVTGLDDSYFDGHTEAELEAISGGRRNALGGPNLDQTVLAFQLNDGPTVPAASTTLNPVKFLDHESVQGGLVSDTLADDSRSDGLFDISDSVQDSFS